MVNEEAQETLFTLVDAYFKAQDWAHQSDPVTGMVKFPHQGRHGIYPCFVHTDEPHAHCLVYAILPLMTPAACRSSIMEYITSANYGLAIGNLELDSRDGEVRCKASAFIPDKLHLSEQLEVLITHATALLDKYVPGFMVIIEQGATPQAALDLVEG